MDAPGSKPAPDEEEDERVGCLDIVAATAGIGCALAVRTVIIVGAFVILIVALKFVGFGSGSVHHRVPLTATPVLRYGAYGWALVLTYLLDLQKELRGRVVNQFHGGVDVLE